MMRRTKCESALNFKEKQSRILSSIWQGLCYSVMWCLCFSQGGGADTNISLSPPPEACVKWDMMTLYVYDGDLFE